MLFSDLSANTVYDLSAHLINLYDMSNNKLIARGVTRPSDFVSSDIEQNISSTTSSILVLNVNNSQIAGTLNINKYMVDVSGNNGTNATKQTKTKVPILQLATSINNDVSLNDLSANTFYDLSINLFNVEDMSNNKIVASGITRPTDFSNNGRDVSQNTTISNIAIDSIVMNIKHKDAVGTLDISGYTIKYSARGNSDSAQIIKSTTNKDPNNSNYDVSINNLQFPNSIYDMSINLFNVYDMSNTFIDISGFTRPGDFTVGDISQNLNNNYTNRINMGIFHSQVSQSLDISGYTIKYAARGNNDSSTIIKSATKKGPTQSNFDVSINNLTRPNTIYDMSINLFNINLDVSNSFFDISGHTKPSDFESKDLSQNISSTTTSSLYFNIFNSQLPNSIDISGYTLDYSGNNGTNASKGSQTVSTTNKKSNDRNTDVVVSDLSANTFYDLSAHLFNIYEISNNKIIITGSTRPTNFTNNGKDVSQNMISSNVTINKIVMNVKHKDVAGTLDISGYTIKYSAQGNSDSNMITKSFTIKSAHLSNYDISINNLQYPNSVYDMSINLFNVQDMSNAYIDISGLTKPSDFVDQDVSQNRATTSSSSIVLNINSSQHENSVTIKNYVIDVSGNNGENASKLTRTLNPTTKT